MVDEISDPLDVALWAPKPLKQNFDERQEYLLDKKALSDIEHQNLLLQIQKELVEYGIHVSDLNNISFNEITNIIIKLLEGKKIYKSLQPSKFRSEDDPIDHDAIEANSIDIHEFSFEAIEAKKIDVLIKKLIILMQHAASLGKYLLFVPGGSEPAGEYIAEIHHGTELAIPFLHQSEKEEKKQNLVKDRKLV